MFMISGPLRIGLLTDHVPVKDVVSQISESLIIQKINSVIDTLKSDFAINKPKIAVLGINPHVGDNGVVRYEYEYIRNGTAVLLGAFDVATGDAFGEVVPHRTADALVNFMEYVAERYPALQITIIWDNLNTHYDAPDKRWTRFKSSISLRSCVGRNKRQKNTPQIELKWREYSINT